MIAATVSSVPELHAIHLGRLWPICGADRERAAHPKSMTTGPTALSESENARNALTPTESRAMSHRLQAIRASSILRFSISRNVGSDRLVTALPPVVTIPVSLNA